MGLIQRLHERAKPLDITTQAEIGVITRETALQKQKRTSTPIPLMISNVGRQIIAVYLFIHLASQQKLTLEQVRDACAEMRRNWGAPMLGSSSGSDPYANQRQTIQKLRPIKQQPGYANQRAYHHQHR